MTGAIRRWMRVRCGSMPTAVPVEPWSVPRLYVSAMPPGTTYGVGGWVIDTPVGGAVSSRIVNVPSVALTLPAQSVAIASCAPGSGASVLQVKLAS
jgi:hypothetical protein